MNLYFSLFRNADIGKSRKIPASCLCIGLLVLACLFISASPLYAGQIHDGSGVTGSKTISIPSRYGRIVYRCNEDSPNQLFIIGIGHRDTVTRANGKGTVAAQVEVYRIAEWLAMNRDLELLLPEGFFSDGPVKGSHFSQRSPQVRKNAPPDTEALKERLGDNVRYVNAEMLLSETYGMQVRQVEDAKLYDKVRAELRSLEESRDDGLNAFLILADLKYLEGRRTAAMLQKIPGIIDQEYAEGLIHRKEALFTIGLAHISGIISYLKHKQISVQSPAFTSFADYKAKLNLLNDDFGVTVIIPRSLAAVSRALLASGSADKP